MTCLDCSVTGCMYNEDQSCRRKDILVEGKEARETQGTCCGRFRGKKSTCVENALTQPSKETRVSCEACHCKFNENNECKAKHIGIAGAHACTCGETECASFAS